ncbi:sporulation membrane protein YtaF [Paenibacillus chitinolyticus]|uniref:sporulation membrane protein YtaF n=1 Tax=Paenibacillus chitinolyticus TaxID=79263 RepID=UPI0026E4CE10|nr:sporulation membrane protein YtaF [Paenibacillus chitinolyticus]GKS12716.1 sporulation membrane protein YtaF [Paenibacillus chitinolyticus]
MAWLLILGFAISSSLDNLGVGISYGIRKIRIGILSNLIVAVVCFLFSFTGIWFGKWISSVLPGMLPVLLGAFSLFFIGIRIILMATPGKEPEIAPSSSKSNGNGLRSILRNPEQVDRDNSKHIGIAESLILGIALSANALTNGLSAGLLGLSPFAISLTAAFGSFLTVWLGVWLGGKVAGIRIGSFTLGQFGTLVSGMMLLVIAANSLL